MKLNEPKSTAATEGYPVTWTNYFTVGELRAWLASPMMLDGDLTNITGLRRESGIFHVVADVHAKPGDES